MAKYTFHSILEHGLGDYDEADYEYEVTDEEAALIEKANASNDPFDEVDALHDLYHRVFETAFFAEKKKYLDKMYDKDPEMVEGEDFPSFEDLTFYMTL